MSGQFIFNAASEIDLYLSGDRNADVNYYVVLSCFPSPQRNEENKEKLKGTTLASIPVTLVTIQVDYNYVTSVC